MTLHKGNMTYVIFAHNGMHQYKSHLYLGIYIFVQKTQETAYVSVYLCVLCIFNFHCIKLIFIQYYKMV